jgi:hypothetical protein
MTNQKGRVVIGNSLARAGFATYANDAKTSLHKEKSRKS